MFHGFWGLLLRAVSYHHTSCRFKTSSSFWSGVTSATRHLCFLFFPVWVRWDSFPVSRVSGCCRPARDTFCFIIDTCGTVYRSDDLFFDDDPETQLTRYMKSFSQIVVISNICDDMSSSTAQSRFYDDGFFDTIKYFFGFFKGACDATLWYWGDYFFRMFLKRPCHQVVLDWHCRLFLVVEVQRKVWCFSFLFRG